jgi:hypothetical protein
MELDELIKGLKSSQESSQKSWKPWKLDKLVTDSDTPQVLDGLNTLLQHALLASTFPHRDVIGGLKKWLL